MKKKSGFWGVGGFGVFFCLVGGREKAFRSGNFCFWVEGFGSKSVGRSRGFVFGLVGVGGWGGVMLVVLFWLNFFAGRVVF